MELHEIIEKVTNNKEELEVVSSFVTLHSNAGGEAVPDSKKNHSVIKAKYEIIIQEMFTQVDLIFPSVNEPEIFMLWNALEDYGKKVHERYLIDTKELYEGVLVITPFSLNGEKSLAFDRPVFWTLQPERPNQECKVIRLLFLTERIFITEDKDIDLTQLEAAADREWETELELEETGYEE